MTAPSQRERAPSADVADDTSAEVSDGTDDTIADVADGTDDTIADVADGAAGTSAEVADERDALEESSELEEWGEADESSEPGEWDERDESSESDGTREGTSGTGDRAAYAADVAGAEAPRRRSRARILARKYQRAKRQIRLLRVGLVAAIGLAMLSALSAAWIVRDQRGEVARMRIAALDAERRADHLEEALDERGAALQALLEDRIEGLSRIDLGEPIRTAAPLVRSIEFEEIDLGYERQLAYRLVLENPEPRFVVPDLELVLFDPRGFQLRTVAIRPGEAGHTKETLGLWAGDVRTVNGRVRLGDGAMPAHFVVRPGPTATRVPGP